MIIECPKCKTKFEVADASLVNGEMKFQCSECAYIFDGSCSFFNSAYYW